VAVVTTPFSFEAARRRRNAEAGLAQLQPRADTVISVPNDKLLTLVGRTTALDVSLRVADEVLRQGVQGLAELVGRPGLINVDFAHVRSIMARGASGRAMMAIGHGRGEDKAIEAVRQALKMPLLEAGSVENAGGLLVHFTGGDDLGLYEASRAMEEITRAAPQAEVVFGLTLDSLMKARAQVILIATGLPLHSAPIPLAPAISYAPPQRGGQEASSMAEPSQTSTGHLAEALFSRAIAAPDPTEPPWVVTESSAPSPNSLDMPAFLRKRRTLRDFGL
jgi:cell division protein FtsZ